MSPFRSGFREWWQGVVGQPVDNRRTPRFEFRNWVEVRVAEDQFVRGIARDLSAKGICVILQADLQLGEPVLIKYHHPKSPGVTQTLARWGVVRSRYGYRYGFEFDCAMDFWSDPKSHAENPE